MAKIYLFEVLMRIQLEKFGTVLNSRPAGKEAFLVFQPSLSEVKDKEGIEVDFEGISVLTPSWADEFITPLSQQFEGRVTLLHTENPSVHISLETLRKSRAVDS